MDNLEEMAKSLEKYSFLKLNQDGIENMNRPIITSEIEAVTKNLPVNESPESDGYTGVFYQTEKS